MANELFKTDGQRTTDAKLEEFLEKNKPQEAIIEKTETPIAETPVEPPKVPEVQPAETPKEEWSFKLDRFNESFGTAFGDEDSLKEYLKKQEDLGRLSEIDSKYKDLEQKYQEAREQLNPRKHFVSDEEYKRQLILSKYKEEVNPNLLGKIVSHDMSKLSDLDVLILGKQVGNPNLIGGDEGARQLIYSQFGIDAEEMGNDPEKWSALVKNRLSDAAAPVRKSLNEIKNVEVPQVQDFETQRQTTIQAAQELKTKLKDGWTKVVDRLVKDFGDYEYLEGKKYKVDDDFKKMATGVLLEHLIDNDLDLSEDNIKKAQVYLRSEFWQQRGQDILRSHVKDIEAQFTEKKMKEEDNPKPRNQTEMPKAEIDKQQEELKQYVHEGRKTGKIKLG